jgi:hypothetical protein
MAIKTFLCTVKNSDRISVDASEPNVGGSFVSIHIAPEIRSTYDTLAVQLSMKDSLKLAEQLIKNARKGEQR